jgi:hypothetical protein
MKYCPKCKTQKETSFFAKNPCKKDGLSGYCKECQKASNRISRKKNQLRETVLVPLTKICYRCNTEKAAPDFYENKGNRDGLSNFCKKCTKEGSKKNKDKNRNRQNVAAANSKRCPRCKIEKPAYDFYPNKGNKDGLFSWCKKCEVIYRRKCKFKVTEEWFQEKLNTQNGSCAICKTKFTDDNPPCVDHNHFTEENRGLLCGNCNCAIGHLKESINNLKSAIVYLEKYNGPL